MSGYDRDLVVGVADRQLDDLTCAICHCVMKNPVMTECCQQTYCRHCITQWIVGQSSCPNDRKPLTTDQLRAVPRVMKNMINELPIKCEFASNGCTSVVTAEEYDKHRDYCEFNPRGKCKICRLRKDSDHNCIDSLLEEISKVCVKSNP